MTSRRQHLIETDPRYREAAGLDARDLLPCPERGERAGEVECPGCGPGVRLVTYQCRRHGTPATLARTAPGLPSCHGCLTHGDPWRGQVRPAALAPPFPAQTPAPPAVAVAVGTWGPCAPALVRLQARWLRRTCPGVPLLVSDDASPCGAELEAAAREEGAALWRSAERLGHAGGDLAAVWRGLAWAVGIGAGVLVKLSQRFVPLTEGWATDSAAELLATGEPPLPLATARSDGPDVWPLRTECLVLAVDRWRAALPALTPRAWPGRYAEHVLADALAALPGPSTVCWPLSWLPPHRGARSDRYLWHQSSPRADYERAAAAVGLTLPPEFTVAASGEMEGYLP